MGEQMACVAAGAAADPVRAASATHRLLCQGTGLGPPLQ